MGGRYEGGGDRAGEGGERLPAFLAVAGIFAPVGIFTWMIMRTAGG